MSFNTWTPLAVSSEAQDWQGAVWRMVEAQHIASTMKLVDSQDEQDLLETLLESSKPARPAIAKGLDTLLATPFRYDPLRGGSRFRSVTDPGVFYGAESVRTAGAELGYWRWKFLKDAIGLEKIEPVAHTAFRAGVSTVVADLRKPPFSTDAEAWTHPTDYSATQAFARVCTGDNRRRYCVSIGSRSSSRLVYCATDGAGFLKTPALSCNANLVARRASGRSHLETGSRVHDVFNCRVVAAENRSQST